MNKKIREGMAKIVFETLRRDEITDKLLTFLDKNNVVQIEEGKLPPNKAKTRRCFTSKGELHAFDTGYFAAQQDKKDSIKRLI